ncbi:hypothetical protein [uncultured Brachyspira sp.]|uniref:hypothetical protein n=1 Tax=uncultured Brachyspira sp. TaxID=221953 RepID=UPI0025DD6049|nr:hypothetical protein [uncultured Brachyspira sp.]
MRKRNNNPLDKSYLKQPGPDLEINSYLIPIYRNYFIRTGEISANKDYKLINEELNFNHNRVQFNIDSKIKSNSEIHLSSSCIPNYIFNQNVNFPINASQFSYDLTSNSIKLNFGNYKIFITPNTIINIPFNGGYPIPIPPAPLPEPIIRTITLQFSSLIKNFSFSSDLYIKKGSVIRLPSSEKDKLLDLSNPGKNPKSIPPIKLDLDSFQQKIPPEYPGDDTHFQVYRFKSDLFKNLSIIKSIDNSTPIDFDMIFFCGEFKIPNNFKVNQNMTLSKGSIISFENQPVPPGPVNPEVVNISLDFETNSYSPDNDFYISKDSIIQIDPNLLTGIEIVKPGLSSKPFNLPYIINLQTAASYEPDEDDPYLIHYHFPQATPTRSPYYFYSNSILSFMRNITASKFDIILNEQNPEWICDGIIPAIGSRIRFNPPPIPFPELLQYDVDFSNPSLTWQEDKAIAQNSYVRISPDIMKNLQIIKDMPLMFPLSVINVSEFEKEEEYPVIMYKKTYMFTQDRNRFLWKDSRIQVLVQIPSAVYNITLTKDTPEWHFTDESILISPQTTIKAIYPPDPLPPAAEVLEVTLSPYKSDKNDIYRFPADQNVAKDSYFQIDSDLCFDIIQQSNTDIPVNQASFDDSCRINYRQNPDYSWNAFFTITNYILTDDQTSVLVKPNVTLNAITTTKIPAFNIQLNQKNPVYTLEAGMYGQSTFSIANELIPELICPSLDDNEPSYTHTIKQSSIMNDGNSLIIDIPFSQSVLFQKYSTMRIIIR